MSDIAFISPSDNIAVTDGPAFIRLVVPINLEEIVVLPDIMTDNATIRIERPQ